MTRLHELRDFADARAPDGVLIHEALGLTFYRTEDATQPLPVVYKPVLCVSLRGAKRIVLGDEVIRFGEGQYLTVSVDLPMMGQVIEAPYLALAIDLEPATIADLMLQAPPAGRGSEAGPALRVSPAGPDLLDPLIRLARLLDTPRDIPVLGPMIRREVMWRLIQGPEGAMARQIGLADSRLSQINRAVQWLREHYAAPLRVERLAEIAGMSGSAFHRHFKTVTAMSPLQYQKQLRLQEARARLLSQPGDVAGIGFSVGYESPSQFSREYARLFGDPPARDAARLRDTAASEWAAV